MQQVEIMGGFESDGFVRIAVEERRGFALPQQVSTVQWFTRFAHEFQMYRASFPFIRDMQFTFTDFEVSFTIDTIVMDRETHLLSPALQTAIPVRFNASCSYFYNEQEIGGWIRRRWGTESLLLHVKNEYE